jgi:D-alanyl-D-alanine dipeptidase
MIEGFRFIDEVVPELRWDAKYATWDNFTGKPVDGYLANRVVGTDELCAALAVARDEAAALGFGLLVWDAYRPQRATECFLRWSQQPEDGRTKQRHYPNIDRSEMFELGYVAARSGHSRGSTLDLTLFVLETQELAPMGGDHDVMDAVSNHGAPGVDGDEAAHRLALRGIMERSGFAAYETEWWHYSLRDEPYPDTYFDFTVGG